MKKSDLTRVLLSTVLCVSAIASMGSAAQAAYPEHAVRFVVGFPVGGGTDLVARIVAQKLSEKWKQPVVVENKAGADGSLAADQVAHSPADGYTIAWITNAHAVTPTQFKLNYDPVKSFSMLMIASETPDTLAVHPSLPVHNVKELIDYAKAHPGKLNFGGTTGGSTSPDLEFALFIRRTGIEVTSVPYKGAGPMAPALVGNEIQAAFISISAALPQIKAGTMRGIAVTTETRAKVIPELPTISESGLPGFDTSVWYGAVAPAGVPKDVLDKIHNDMAEAMHSDAVRAIIEPLGQSVVADSGDDMAKTITNDMKRWGDLLKSDATH